MRSVLLDRIAFSRDRLDARNVIANENLEHEGENAARLVRIGRVPFKAGKRNGGLSTTLRHSPK